MTTHHYHHRCPAQLLTLPLAVFLIGYVFDTISFGPLSESYGRRVALLSSFLLYTLFTLACAVAPNWFALLKFRFIVGVGASAPPTVLGGDDRRRVPINQLFREL